MKEKEENSKKLIWKYFWQNKLLEVLVLVCIFLIPFSIGKSISSTSLKIMYEGMFKPHMYTGTIGQQWLFGASILFILAMIVAGIYGIISRNWNLAKDKVKRKMEEKEEGDKE